MLYWEISHTNLDCFGSWKVQHVKREFNKVAHELAHYAKCREVNLIWEGCSPPIVSHLILQDRLWCGCFFAYLFSMLILMKVCLIKKTTMVNILLFHLFLIPIWPTNNTHRKEYPLSFLSLKKIENWILLKAHKHNLDSWMRNKIKKTPLSIYSQSHQPKKKKKTKFWFQWHLCLQI